MRILIGAKILIICLTLFNSSCAFFHGDQKKDMNIKREIIKEITTEATVLNLLGLPTSVAPNSIGDEVWQYKNISYSASQSADGRTLILWELTTGASTEPAKLFDLLITFNEQDIVKNFELVFASF